MKRNGEFLVLISIVAFSISDMFDRVAVIDTNAMMATMIKCSLILVFISLVALREGLRFEGYRYFIASGLISEIIGSASFMYALKSGVSAALPLIQAQVMFTDIFSYVLIHERISKKRFFGIIVLFIGLAIITYSRVYAAPSENPLYSIIFALIASAGWGSGAVIWKMGLDRGASSNSGLLVHYATAVSVLFVILLIFKRDAFYVSMKDVSNLAIAALLDGVLGMLALINSLRYISATRAQALKSTYPIAACILAYFIFDEYITLAVLVGMAIATAGVVIFELSRNSIRDSPSDPA